MRLSNSEIQTYKRCKRKWWLAHYRALTPMLPKVVGPLAIGDRVHQALLVRYRGGSWQDELQRLHNNAHAVLERTRVLIEDGEGSATLDAQLVQLNSEAELARLMMEGYDQYVEEEGIDADLEIVDTECMLEAPLFATGYPGDMDLEEAGVSLIGKLDQRAHRGWDNARLFRDFKTVGNMTDPTKSLPRDEQAITYMCLEHVEAAREGEDSRYAPGRFDAALYTLLRKVKRTARATPPFYKQLEVRHHLPELRMFWLRLKEEARDIIRLRRRIDAGEDPATIAYPSPRGTCSWDCEFYEVCPMFDNGDDAEGYIGERYEVGDPLARYNLEEVNA